MPIKHDTMYVADINDVTISTACNPKDQNMIDHHQKRVCPRHNKGIALHWVIIGVIVIAAGAVGGVNLIQNQITGSTVTEQELYEATRINFDIIIPTSGQLEAENSIEIRNKVDGQALIRTIIDEGTFVSKGDVLIELGADDIQRRIADTELQETSATNDKIASEQAFLMQKSENQSSEDKSRLSVELAQLELDRWNKGEVVSKRRQLKLAKETAERNLIRFRREFEDSIKLEKDGFISMSELEQDEIRLIEAQAALEDAVLAIDVYEKYTRPKDEKSKTSDLEEAKAELDRVLERNKSILQQKQSDLDTKDRRLTLIGNTLSDLNDQLDACTVTAPNDGLVVYGTSVGGRRWGGQEALQIGQQVYNNQLLIILPDTQSMIAVVKVHESQFGLIKKGMQANIIVDAQKDLSMDAKVISIGVMAEQGWGTQVREYTIKLKITGTNEWDLKPSMQCKAEIFVGHVEDAIAIPLQAVFIEKGKFYVWVKTDGHRFEQRNVSTDRSSEMMIEVTKGLESGETVLLREPTPGEIAS